MTEQNLKNYYHNNSPKKTLDMSIVPLVEHIKENNIGSLHQLKNHIHNFNQRFFLEPATQFNSTIYVFNTPLPRKSNLFSQKKYKKIGVNYNLLQQKSKAPSTNKVEKYQENPEDEVMIDKKYNKIKRHLIQNIDLQQMQKALYKKRQTINRFQDFCSKIHSRDSSNRSKLDIYRKTATRSMMKNTKYSNQQSQFSNISKIISIDSGQLQCENQFSPQKRFRITSKKNKWRFLYDKPVQEDALRIEKLSKNIQKI